MSASAKATEVARALVEAYEAGVAQRDDVNPGEVLTEMIARALDEARRDVDATAYAEGYMDALLGPP
jgi:hypothetical protein